MPPVKLEAARFGGGAADSTPQYGPIKGAAKFRQNAAGQWIHSETGRFASLSDLHEMHGALGAPLIVPRVVDSATGEVLRNPEPRVEWNAPAIQTSGVVQGANIPQPRQQLHFLQIIVYYCKILHIFLHLLHMLTIICNNLQYFQIFCKIL